MLQGAQAVIDVGYESISQLIRTFISEVYPLYPCIDLERIQIKVNSLFDLLSNFGGRTTADVDLDIIDIEIMKATVAVAQCVSGETQSSLACDLESKLSWSVQSTLDQEHCGIEDIAMATLVSIYLDIRDLPVRAWRMSSYAAKLCLELGIHQRSFYEACGLPPSGIVFHKRMFACVYSLNMKCSFYTALPWTLDSRHVDDRLLDLPEHSYHSLNIPLCKITSEVWDLENYKSSNRTNSCDRADFLTFQLERVVDKMPMGNFVPLEPDVTPPSWLNTSLKHLIQLRVNHAKMLVFVQTFSSLEEMLSHPQYTTSLISLAKSSIEVQKEIMGLPKTGSSPLLFPSTITLLLSSLSFLLLAISYSPQVYNTPCNEAVYTAMDILAKSYPWVKAPGRESWGSLGDLKSMLMTAQTPPERTIEPAMQDTIKESSASFQTEFPPNGTIHASCPSDQDILPMLEGVDTADLMYLEQWPGGGGFVGSSF
ncbi:hypothetical protein BJY04DRAFT_221410 [Aspergillus karnatakaensis]|uniref:fungal specific transcription factor domain-containing protein n=1 Tax=Aspergillus karnatakaensis TaxID=1810916 RepID=UPI003CCD3212